MVAGGMDDLTAFRDKLISLVDLLPDESAKLMEQRPRFAHAVLVLANDLPGEVLKANYMKQLDPYWVQTKGTTPVSPTSQPIQQSLSLQTSNQDTQTTAIPFQWTTSEDKMATAPAQKTGSSETSGICSGGEDISQSSPPPPQRREVPIELSPAGSVPTSKHQEEPPSTHISHVTVVREERAGAGLLGKAVDRREAAPSRAMKTGEIRRETPGSGLSPVERLVQHETHIKSSYLRSQVEQTPFPSQDRQKITRYHSDAEDHLPEYSPLCRQRSGAATNELDDPIIREAIRILEASCQLLDETAHRIAAVNHQENQGRQVRGAKESMSFRFPSEIRRNHGQRSCSGSPNQPFARSTTTTTTKLIKETLTTTNF